MVDLATGLKNPTEIKRIEEINSASVSTISRAIELLTELEKIDGTLVKDSNLKRSLENNFFDNKLEGYSIEKVINELKQLESVNEVEVIEEPAEEIEEDIVETESKEELNQISNIDIKRLMEEYDEYLKKGLNDQEARDKVYQNHPNANKENVDRFIKRQQEIYKETLSKIKEKETVEENKVLERVGSEKLAKIIAQEAVIQEEELSLKVGEDKAKVITDEITSEVIIPHIVEGKEMDDSRFDKFVTLREEDKLEIKETIKIIESKFQIEDKIKELTTQTVNELKQDLRFQDKVELSNTEKVENVIREEIYKELTSETKDVQESSLDEKLVRAIQRTDEIEIEQELKTTIKTQAIRIGKQTEDWVQNNENNFSEIKGQVLAEKIEQQILSENKNITLDQSRNIQEYSKILKEIYTSPSVLSQYKKDLVLKIESPEVNKDQSKEAWTDLRGLTQILKMKPGEFDQFVSRYKQVKNGLGNIKLPYNIKESRSLDSIIRLSDNPAIKSLINRAQRYVGTFEKITNITNGKFMSGFYERIGIKIGKGVIEKIGNQAVKAFAENSLQIIAKNGLEKGIGVILRGVLSGGVKAGATAAAGAGTAAATGGAMAAAGASATVPVVGWIVAGVILAIEAGVKLMKMAGKLAKKLNIDLGIKKFLQETLGNFFGGVVDFGLKVGTVLLAPAAFIGIGAIATITPVIVSVIVGIFAYQLLLGSQVSSLVPPKDIGSLEEATPTRDPSIPIPEGCPSGWPIDSGVITQGPNGGYSHVGVQAIDIANNAVPIYATHNGIAIPEAKIASNGRMGYSVTISGTCEGTSFSTRYAHMPNLMFSNQREVVKGDVIGYVDNSGNSTGPHLHYQLNGLGSINNYLPKSIPEGYRNSASNIIINVP